VSSTTAHDSSNYYNIIADTSASAWPNVDIHFRIRRKPGFYSLYIMPSAFLLVAMAYASLYIDRSAAPARVALAVISFLALTNEARFVRESLPKMGTSVWLLSFFNVCEGFVAVTLFEYAIVNYFMRVHRRVEHVRDAYLTAQGLELSQRRPHLPQRYLNVPSPQQAAPRKAGAASEHASARTAGGTATATAADGWGCSASFDEDVEQDVPSSGLAAQSTAAASTAAPADYATTAAVASAVPVASGGTRPDASPSVRDGMLPDLARIDKLLVQSDGRLRITDEYIEACFRAAMPPAFAVWLGFLFATLPDDGGA